jgi:hypothetical protein
LNLTTRTARDLRLIASYWPGLAETRIPGTPPPWRPSEITPERRAELDHEARLERLERNGLAPGEHPDAVRPEVLDLMTTLLWDATELADQVADTLGRPHLHPPSSGLADPTPWLEFTARHLPEADEQDPALGPHIARQAAAMLGAVSRHLCLMHDGQTLDVVCPWCGGGLTGAATWRVRELPGDQVAIVCESGLCEPPSKAVGTWWRGKPCWPMREWDWLAGQVRAAEGREPAPA